jgi:hypothetical protein
MRTPRHKQTDGKTCTFKFGLNIGGKLPVGFPNDQPERGQIHPYTTEDKQQQNNSRVTSTNPIRTQHAEDIWMKLDSIMTHLHSGMNVTHNTMMINKLSTQ